jgi:hypothetical protein
MKPGHAFSLPRVRISRCLIQRTQPSSFFMKARKPPFAARQKTGNVGSNPPFAAARTKVRSGPRTLAIY